MRAGVRGELVAGGVGDCCGDGRVGEWVGGCEPGR